MNAILNEPAEQLLALLAQREVQLPTDEAGWVALVREADRHRVLPLLHARLRTVPRVVLPEQVAAAIKERCARIALDNALIFRELELLAAALHAAHVPVLLLKGAHLAADVYPARGLRSMLDIDVLVPRAQLAPAADALLRAGFSPEPVADLDAYCRENSHLPRMTPPAGLGAGVEVHWTIELPTSPFDISPAELWTEARTLRVDGRDLLVLSPEHLVLHLCVHACYHHRLDRTPLKQLLDIEAVINRYGEQLDWNALLVTAARWRVEKYVRLALQLARELLAVRVPEAVFGELSAGANEALLGSARAYIMRQGISSPVALDDVVRAHGWADRLQISRAHLFPPRTRLAEIYGLPARSKRVWLWYVLRPFDLLARKGYAAVMLLLPTRMGKHFRHRERNRSALKGVLRSWAKDATQPDEPR